MSFVLSDISQLFTLEGAYQKSGRHILPEDLSMVREAAMVVSASSKILWTGPQNKLPSKFKRLKKIKAHGKTVLPTFIDSHTHLIFGGDRSFEFEMRLAGKTYSEIATQGGGITNSMTATRETSEAVLLKTGISRVRNFLDQGVTTIEIKTGYGLDFKSELKCLRVIQALKKKTPARIFCTFLAAHAIPPEFKERREDYINTIAFEWLPKIKKYCDFVDIFIDKGYFTSENADILFGQCQKLKIPLRVHADELGLTGGTDTALKYKAMSADHLLRITDREIKALSGSEVTATLLPTTAFFLKTEYAPARKLLDQGTRVALATDFNPGTSPTQDISLVGLLAALYMNMRVEEIIVALTLNGAFALGIQKTRGALIVGHDADFMMIESKSLAHFFYSFGQRNKTLDVFAGGRFL